MNRLMTFSSLGLAIILMVAGLNCLLTLNSLWFVSYILIAHATFFGMMSLQHIYQPTQSLCLNTGEPHKTNTRIPIHTIPLKPLRYEHD